MEFPIFINCRDRLTPLRELVAWLEKAGQGLIYLVDNDSSYPPLLDYYETTPHHVVRLGQNLGHKALWLTDELLEIRGTQRFILTDPDIVPIEECPLDALDMFSDVLDRYPDVSKAGFALKIDDLPDHYRFRSEVLRWEGQFWHETVEPGLFRAPIDTTFALYRESSEHALKRGLRTGFPYLARHLSWYVDSNNLPEEDRYYQEHARSDVIHWSAQRVPQYLLDKINALVPAPAAALSNTDLDTASKKVASPLRHGKLARRVSAWLGTTRNRKGQVDSRDDPPT